MLNSNLLEESNDITYELLASYVYFGYPERKEVIGFLKKESLLLYPDIEVEVLDEKELEGFIWTFLDDKKILHPDHRSAGFNLAKYYAKKIIQREVSPYQGAKWIWHRIENEYEYDGEFDQLLKFVGLASEYEDFNDEVNKDFYGEDGAKQKQQEIEDSIMIEASQLLSIN